MATGKSNVLKASGGNGTKKEEEKNPYEFDLHIVPKVFRYSGNETQTNTANEFAKSLYQQLKDQENILEQTLKKTQNLTFLHIKKIELFGINDFLQLKCCVYNDKELEELKNALDSGSLSQKLTNYGESVGLGFAFGVVATDTETEFKIAVSLESPKKYFEGKIHFCDKKTSFNPPNEQEAETLKEKTNVTVGSPSSNQTDSGGHDGKVKTTREKEDQKILDDTETEFGIIIRTFHVFVPVEPKYVNKVTIKSKDNKYIDGVQMTNCPHGSFLWENEVKMPANLEQFTYRFEVDYILVTVHGYVLIPQSLYQRKEKAPGYYLSEEYFHKTSEEHTNHYHAMTIFGDADNVTGYQQFCIHILGNADEVKLKECVMQLVSLHKTLSLRLNDACKVVENIQQHFRCLFYRPKYLAFVAFLCLTFKKLTHLHEHNCVNRDIAQSVLLAVEKSSIEEIPSFFQNIFAEALEELCLKVSQQNYSILAFMHYAYPFLPQKYFTSMLDTKNKIDLLADPLSVSGKAIATRVIKTLVLQVCEKSDLQKDQLLLERIQRHLPLETVFNSIEELDHNYGCRPGKYQDLLQKSKESLHYSCKRELQDIGKKGNLDKLLELWKKINSHRCIETCELLRCMEDAIMNALDKTNGNGHEKLQQECLHGPLFAERESQLKLLFKVAESKHVDIHYLVVIFLKKEKFSSLDTEDVEKIVHLWFECLIKKQFADRSKSQAEYIPQLYSYLADITDVTVVKENKKLKADVEEKTCEFLQVIDIKEIIKKIKVIERYGDLAIEDIYRSHVQKLLFRSGGGKPGSKTVNTIIQEICGMTSLRVNSSLTLGVVETLLDMTGIAVDMSPVETFVIMINGAQFWKKILEVQGSRKYDIMKHPLYTKAAESIKQMCLQLTSGGIECRVMQKLKTKENEVFDMLSSQKSRRKIEEIWNNAFESMRKKQKDCKLIIFVLQRCKPNLPKGKLLEFVTEVIAALSDTEFALNSGSIKLNELQNDTFNQYFSEITEHCCHLQTVIDSKVFWNVCKEILDYSEISQSEPEEESDDETLKSVRLLMDAETDDVDEDEHIKTVCLLLHHLVNKGLSEYHSSWEPYVKGNDVSLAVVQKHFHDANISDEIKIVKQMHKMLNRNAQEAILMYSDFEKHEEKVTAMKNALLAFNVDSDLDSDFTSALSSFEQLCDEDLCDTDLESLTLFGVYRALQTVEKVTKMLDNDTTDILMTVGNSKSLVEFLQEVADEDIRNLIDAVEEHSEQYVQESTVSCLIDIKRFFQPLLKNNYSGNVADFFSAITKSSTSSGIKNIPQKIHECMDNLHSLKALYKNVANRGERTKEIVENVVKKGRFHFILSVQKCQLTVEYKQDKKNVEHSEAGLNDLRSRALLIMNTEEKKRSTSGAAVKSKDYLSPFVKLIDTALEIVHILTDLQFSGHFNYTVCDRKVNQEELDSVRDKLENEYTSWCSILNECRSKFYFMNFVYSDQIQLLYQYFEKGINESMIVPILKYIHRDVEVSEDTRQVYKSFAIKHTEDPKLILACLGKTIHCILESTKPLKREFKIPKTTKQICDSVQESKLCVAALEEGSHLTIRTVLALYLNTTGQLPEVHQILFCSKDTKWDEILILLLRCIGALKQRSGKELFCIANVEMLSSDLQFMLVEKLRSLPRNSKYLLSIICRGNERHPFLDQFRECIVHPRSLTDVQMTKCFEIQWADTSTITSDFPGLGKTERVKQMASRQNMDVSTLHISGPFQKKSLVERLIMLKVKPYHVLHIDIGMIDNPTELDSFLFELIILGCASAGTTSFFLPTRTIFIEVANTVNQSLCNSLSTVTCFKRQNLKWENYRNFKASMEINSPVQVVCNYLKVLEEGALDQIDLFCTGPNKFKPLPAEDCQRYLQKHFSVAGDLSFTLVNTFLNVLADQLKKLSASIYFRTANIAAMLGDKKVHSVKSNLVLALLDVSKEFSARSIHSCRSTQIASLSFDDTKPEVSVTTPTITTAEALAMRVAGMIRWEDSNHLMVLFHQDVQTISALYRDKKKVPDHVKNLIESQVNRKLEDFHQKNQTELQDVLQRLARVKSSPIECKTLKSMAENYALTPDNLLKMVLITLRIKAHIPVIIMGETGCGKTSLVRYLSQICGVSFEVLSIHAGTIEDNITSKVMDTNLKAKKELKETIWLFLDEINTCDHLGLICDIVCHHKLLGTTLSPNLVLIAACNPYRLREEESIFTTGLQGKIKSDELSRLVYRVHPLPETMVDYVWDYGSLSEKDENAYIRRMVHSTFEDENLCHLLSDLLTASQAFVRKTEGTESCVSLRDVDRCKRLVKWFEVILQRKVELKSPGRYIYAVNLHKRETRTNAVILALALCYHSRFSCTETRATYRGVISDVFVKHGSSTYQIYSERDIAKIIQKEQRDIIDRMDLPEGTAKNTALQENVFVILVCILNRIPVFVVGKPGCSKSLSMQLIRSNLRGKDSRDEFFQTLPQLYCVSFQGSESSTSDGIIKIFDKAKRYQEHNKIEDVMSVVILDEIGLAEISRFNPLKVLHSLLEPENKICPDVAVVGLSNWALDAAKMNRAIHLSRPDMDLEELYETGISISESILVKPEKRVATMPTRQKTNQLTPEKKKLLKAIAHAYFDYNQSQKFKNFHGLRDYYSLTKHVSRMLLSVDLYDDEKVGGILMQGLLRNLGGLPSEMETIKSIFQKHLELCLNFNIPVLELIKENIFDKIGRHLMLITSGDAVISRIEQLLRHHEREYMVIFGSQFEEDMTDDYNYRILSRIILCMEQGFVLILKDLEGIYGSLYDMLNQNYTVVGQKKNCRVALGPYSNPMCQVHDDFKCIVLVEERKLDYSDPPFLNRFEKQQFRFEDILDEKDHKVIEMLEELIKALCDIQHHHFTAFDAFPIHSADMLASLVLLIKGTLKEDQSPVEIAELCVKHLLQVSTPEAIVRIRRSVLWKRSPTDANRTFEEYLSIPIHNGLDAYLSSQIAQLENDIVSSGEKSGIGMKPEYSLTQDQLSEPEDILAPKEFAKPFAEESAIKDEMSVNPCVNKDDQKMSFVIFTHSNIHSDLKNCMGRRKYQSEKVGGFKSEKQLISRIKIFFESEIDFLLLQFSATDDSSHILLTKSAVENCRASYQKERSSMQNKYVCMIIHLERKESQQNSISQLNFLSGWPMVTLDALEKPRTTLPDIIDMTIPNVLKNRRPLFESIKEQLFWAFTCIQYTSASHSIDNMKKLLHQMQSNDEFLEDIESIIFKWIEDQTDSMVTLDWQVDIACNRFALSSAATFMDAVESHILDMIKRPLAMLIFRLEEANASECFFIDDIHSRDRQNVWRELVYNSSFINLKDTKPPTGPECYNCTVPAVRMKMPFSQIIITKVEQLKSDFLDTLKKLKVYCEIEEEDVPLTVFLDLVSKYQDIIMQEVGELLNLDYEGKREDYIHDYCSFIVSKSVLSMDMEISIFTLHWELSNYIDLSVGDFGELITKLHAAFWTYSQTIQAVLQLVDLSSDIFDTGVIEMLQEMSTSAKPGSCVDKDSDLFGDNKITSNKPEKYVLSDKLEPFEDESFENSETLMPHNYPHVSSVNVDFTDISSLTECLDTSESETTGEKWKISDEVTPAGDAPIKYTTNEEIRSPIEYKEEISVHDIKPVFIDDDKDLPHQDNLVKCICKHVLPTHNLLKKMSVSSWKRMLSNMLPLIGQISLELEEVHRLRFCSDIANVLIVPFNLPSDFLAIFGSHLKDSVLDSEEMFQLVLKKVNELDSEYGISCIQLQRVICLYIGRCLASNPDSETVMKNVLVYVGEENLVDPKLNFLGPTLRHAIQMELSDEDDILKDLLDNEVTENILLEDLTVCLDRLNERGHPDSVFATLLVDVLENLFLEDLTVDMLRAVESSNDEIVQTTLLADKTLRSECFSLRHVVALAYLRAYLKNIATLILEDLTDCSKHAVLFNNTNPLLEPGTDTELDINRSKGLLYFLLKCMSNGKTNSSVQKVCRSVSEMIPNFGRIDWNPELSLSSLEHNPLAIHCPELYSEYISVISLHDDDDDESALKKIITEAVTSNKTMLTFLGVVLNRYVFKKLVQDITDSEKTFAIRLLEQASSGLKPEQVQVLKCLAGKVDFGNAIYNLTPEAPENEAFMLSVLLHLLCILTAYECSGNVFFNCMTQPEVVDLNNLPGCTRCRTEIRLPVFTCTCSFRCVSKTSKCPVCSQEIKKTETSTKFNVDEEISPIANHILQFFINGCFMNSLALKYSNEELLQIVLSVENKDEVVEEVQNRLSFHWYSLQKLLGINDKDLCGILNIALLKCTALLVDPSFSQDKPDVIQSIEKQLLCILDKVIQDRFALLLEYRSTVYQVHSIPPDAVECHLDEVITIDDEHNKLLSLPSLFRYTGIPTRDNLYAELFIDSKYLSYSFLHLVLHNIEKLSLPQFITPLLKWHLATVTFGSYMIRKVECKETMVGKFISKGGNEITKKILRKQFKQFEDAWNRLKGEFTNELKAVNPELPSLESVSTGSKVDQCVIMDSDSPLYVVLCLLVQIQNTFLDETLEVAVKSGCSSINFMNADEQSARVAVLPLTDVEDKDVIGYDWDDEVLQYAQCETELGHGKKILYDFAKIEMELAHDIVLRKPYIAIPKAITKIVFTDELFQNSVSLLQELRVTIPQEPLTSEIIKGMKKKSDKDTTESLTLLGMVLTILKKTGGDSSLPLVEFIEKWKDVIAQSSFKRLLPEPEHCVKLCHIVALYEWLEELNGENVYESLEYLYRMPLPPDAQNRLEETAATKMKLLENLGRTLKVFVHRCLSSKDNDIDIERPLIDYIIDPTFWQEGTIECEYVVVDVYQPKVKLVDVVSRTLMVEHIYDAITFIQQKIEEHKEKDKRISSIVATYQASKPDVGTKPKKGRTARKGFGKT